MSASTTLPQAAACAPAAPAAPDPALDAERIALMAKALGDPLRVRVVDVLRRSPRPICQCELVELFGVAQSLLSHHIARLVEVDLVKVERRRQWAYYSVPPEAVAEMRRWLR